MIDRPALLSEEPDRSGSYRTPSHRWTPGAVCIALAGLLISIGANLPWAGSDRPRILAGSLDMGWDLYLAVLGGGMVLMVAAVRRWKVTPALSLAVAAVVAAIATVIAADPWAILRHGMLTDVTVHPVMHTGFGLAVLYGAAATAVAGAALARSERGAWGRRGRSPRRSETVALGNVIWLNEDSRRRAIAAHPDRRQAAFLIHLATFTLISVVGIIVYVQLRPAIAVAPWWVLGGWSIGLAMHGWSTTRRRQQAARDDEGPADRRRGVGAVSTAFVRPPASLQPGNVVALRPRRRRRSRTP